MLKDTIILVLVFALIIFMIYLDLYMMFYLAEKNMGTANSALEITGTALLILVIWAFMCLKSLALCVFVLLRE